MKKMSPPNKAFSLIEVSVVILVIGILVSGISYGVDLYKSFTLSKARSLTQNSRIGRIPDLALWFETTSQRSFLKSDPKDGDLIDAWRDINPFSSAGIALTQTDNANKPKYVVNGINNLPAIYFDSTKSWTKLFNSNIQNLSRESTVFMVFSYDKIQSSGAYIMQINGGIADSVSLEFNINDSGQITIFYYRPGLNTNFISPEIYTRNNAKIFRYLYAPSLNSAKIFINSNLSASGPASFAGNFFESNKPSASLHLGNHSSASRTFGGHIGEFVYFNRALTDKESQEIETYLANKWGIKK